MHQTSSHLGPAARGSLPATIRNIMTPGVKESQRMSGHSSRLDPGTRHKHPVSLLHMAKASTTRSTAKAKPPPAKKARIATPTKPTRPRKVKAKAPATPAATDDSDDPEESSVDGSEDYRDPDHVEESEPEPELDSDALDEEDEDIGSVQYHAAVMRKSASASPQKKTAAKPSTKKSGKKRPREESEEDEDDDDENEDGITIVGRVVQAPKNGQGALPSFHFSFGFVPDDDCELVPPGRISQNTFDFLARLSDPACNDRVWFKLHGK